MIHICAIMEKQNVPATKNGSFDASSLALAVYSADEKPLSCRGKRAAQRRDHEPNSTTMIMSHARRDSAILLNSVAVMEYSTTMSHGRDSAILLNSAAVME